MLIFVLKLNFDREFRHASVNLVTCQEFVISLDPYL